MGKTENSTPYSPRYGEAETGGTGRLKIFFGYAAGVGKTYAMLEAAHQAQKEGVDVVVGYVEPHARPDTLALLEGLEVLSCREVDYRGIRLREFDLDGALARRPQLILVDELAHSNAPGCRHTKRYQDVEELLQAGINVYTTVNVQHLESLNDLVTSITGIVVNERIPDHVFDRANQVELVDIAPADLEKRLEEGKIYRQRQAKQALENFFTAENLTALRERLRTQRPVPWDQLPDFSLYMDQVLSYMDRQVIRFDEDDGLTAAMVNNYTKSGLVPRAEGKKYSRDHLAYLTAICVLKRVMSTRDMDLLIREELQGDRPISDGYAAFCASLDKALTAAADEMAERTGEEELADAAIHFALMSYAAGVASSRYVTLLRQRQEAREEAASAAHAKSKERAKKEKEKD